MKRATRRPRTTRGAVLIMVLTVMFVLIFLLAGTIAVVYSAHNRAMTKYQESQAYYTARSVLDTYVESYLTDNANNLTGAGASEKYYYFEEDAAAPSGWKLSHSDATTPFRQGRALELDLYKVPVSTETDPTKDNYNEWFKEILDNCTDPTHITGTSHNAAGITAHENEVNFITSLYSTDATTLNGISIQNFYKQYSCGTDGWKKADTSYKVGTQDTITYTVGSMDGWGSATSTNYGKLTDVASTAKITVQVLERKFDLDETQTNFYDKFRYGDRTKDHFKLKITSYVTYNGEVTTTSAIIENEEEDPPSAAGAIVSLSDISGADTITAMGGASSLYRSSTMIWQNNMSTTGSIFIQGNVTTQSTDPYIHLAPKDLLFVRGTLEIKNGLKASTNGATVYANRIKLSDTKPPQIGASGQDFNIICETLEITEKTSKTYGQIFAEEIDCKAFGTGAGTFSSTIFQGTGNIYCNYLVLNKDQVRAYTDGSGNVVYEIDGNATQGDMAFMNVLAAGKTLNIAKGIKLYDQTAGVSHTYNIGDSIDINGDGTADGIVTITTKPVSGVTSGTLTTNTSPANEVKVSYEYDAALATQDFTFNDAAKVKEYVLPANLIGKSGTGANKMKIDTVQSLYGEYFEDATTTGTYAGDTWDAYGDFNTAVTTPAWDITDDTKTRAFVEEHVKSAETLRPEVGTNTITNVIIGARDQAHEDTFDAAARIPSSYNKVISTDTRINANTDNGVVAVDARTNSINIQLGDGTGGKFYGEFVIFGDKNVNFLMPAIDASGSPATNIDYYLGDTAHGLKVYDIDLGFKPTPINIEGAAPATDAPNICYYAAKGVREISIGTHSECIQGYFTCPFTTFTLAGGLNGYTPVVNTPDFPNCVNSNNSIAVIGSVFCRGYGSDQKPGVVYIANNNKDIPNGQPLFEWAVNRNLK